MSSRRIVTGFSRRGATRCCSSLKSSSSEGGSSRAKQSSSMRNRPTPSAPVPRSTASTLACAARFASTDIFWPSRVIAGLRQFPLQVNRLARYSSSRWSKSRRVVGLGEIISASRKHRPAPHRRYESGWSSSGKPAKVGMPFSRVSRAACEPCPNDSTTIAFTSRGERATTSDGSSRWVTSTPPAGMARESESIRAFQLAQNSPGQIEDIVGPLAKRLILGSQRTSLPICERLS